MSEIALGIASVSDDVSRPTPETVQVPNTSVDILYPTAGNIHVFTHQSLHKAYAYDAAQGWGILSAEHAKFSGANISKVRNQLVDLFLAGDSEWALFLDTDMVLGEDTIARLLCSAEVSGADVIGALCVMDGHDGPIPTIYQLGNFAAGEVTRVMLDYPDDQILQVAATGTACLLVKRCVFESLAELQPGNPYPWFKEDVINGKWISEDIWFCLMANAAGHPVFVDCTTPVGHAKGSRILMPQDIRDSIGFPKTRNYVVIPVKDRFEMTTNLIKQLRDQGETDQIVIVNNGSGRKLTNWLSSQDDLIVLDMPDSGVNAMWNAGAEVALADGQRRNINIAFLNNDLVLGDNFISGLSNTLRSDEKLMAVCANYDGREIQAPYMPTTDICAGRYDGTGGFAGFAFMLRAEFMQSGYRFPEECKWWFGDNDLVLMIQYAAGKVGIAAQPTVEHIDGGSQSAGDVAWSRYSEQTQKDKEAFEARWAQIIEQVESK